VSEEQPELDDVELERTPEPEPAEPDAPGEDLPLGPIVAGLAVLALGVGGALFWAFGRQQPAASPSKVPSTAAAARPSPSPTAVPTPLAEASDATVRALLAGLSSHAAWPAWLAAEGLVARVAVVVDNVAEGLSPAVHLPMLQPKGSFAVLEKQGKLVVDPQGYARYDEAAAVFASLDGRACWAAHAALLPFLESAYKALGHPEGGFDEALGRAIRRLRETPLPEGELAVKPVVRAVLEYEYLDSDLELLSPAQKHLLRMGPANQRKVQAKLAELEVALGLPAPVRASAPPAEPPPG
jgi:hypothetical protein